LIIFGTDLTNSRDIVAEEIELSMDRIYDVVLSEVHGECSRGVIEIKNASY